MDAIPSSYDDFFEDTLESFDEVVLARGLRYAHEGRVQLQKVDDASIRAIVTGTQRYAVEISHSRFGLTSGCSCMAYQREAECKHIAAVAYTIRPASKRAAGAAREDAAADIVPPVLQHVRSASTLLAWMGIDARKLTGGHREYAPLPTWWSWTRHMSAHGRRDLAVIHADLRAIAPAIERELAALRAFELPPVVDDGSAYAELLHALADLHDSHRARAAIVGMPPWSIEMLRTGTPDPPRLRIEFDAREWVLHVTEPSTTPQIADRTLSFDLTTPARSVPIPRSQHFTDPLGDAWRIHALRELYRMLHTGADPIAQSLAERLAAPSWEATLAHVERQRTAEKPAREWCFTVTESYGNAVDVGALSRQITRVRKKTHRWKSTPLGVLFDDEGSTELERRIGTMLLASGVHSRASRFELGTAHAHEILSLLAQHPRVTYLGRDRYRHDDDLEAEGEEEADDASGEPKPEIVASDLVVRLVEGDRHDGSLSARFFAGDLELDARTLDAAKGAFYGAITGGGVLSVAIPRGARAWISAVASRPMGFSFPKQAAPRLVAAIRPLVASGHAQVPASALGRELPFELEAGARVLWGPGAYASVEVLVRPHPAAPLVLAGIGAEVFTFEHEGAPVFVMRDLARERDIAHRLADALDAIAEPLSWSENVGSTEDAASTIALGRWLDENPLRIAIEVKRGRPPSVVAMDTASGDIRVSREGAWLVLGGALDVHGTKITFGEVLEAARRARRYIEAKPGVFLELTEETSAKLAMLAAAADLAGAAPNEAKIHHGLRAAVEGARIAFPALRGLDGPELAMRLAESRADTKRKKKTVDVDTLLEHGTLRAYQAAAVRWMLDLTTWAPGCVLADDMGLGKTVQTATILRARAKAGPQLILAPASVASNWMSELRKFVPSLKARFFNEENAVVLGELGPGDVVVASYGILLRRRAALQDPTWTTVVVDEAQYVKNTTAQRTEAVRALTRDFTIALTGTPIENHLGELFSVVDAAVPGLLGVEMVFRERFRRPIEGRGDSTQLALLTRLLAPFVLRRTRARVLDDLPEREEITEYVELSAAERKHYLALRKACEAALSKRKPGETSAQLKIAILAALLRLRQLACDVRLVDDRFEGESTKIARITQLATQIAEEGSRAIVFSQFTQFLDKIRHALEAAGLRVAYLTGETPTTKRRALIEAFQRGEHDIFCVSLMAGGTGLNLTAASYVIHADPWWNPAVEEQATSRAHRMGQTEPVTVYRLVARGTIEEAVVAMHAAKRGLAEAVLAGHGDAKSVTPAELLDLLRFGES